MGHIVFAAPSISRFHLHERLRRELLRRGHRVTVLCTERCRFTFWREQGGEVESLVPGGPEHDDTPVAQFATRTLADRAQRRRLARLAPAARRWCERTQPDLVLLHGERTATAALLQFAARTVGSRVLWLGDGLLPHTMQVDERGLDGDASCLRWSARDYRVVVPEPDFLDASLAHALAATPPLSLPRAAILVPPQLRRLGDAAAYLAAGRFQPAMSALHAWRNAFSAPPAVEAATPAPFDAASPFVAVLLQAAGDARLRLDADAEPRAAVLVAAALAAATDIDAAGRVVAVLPPGGHATRTELAPLARRFERLHIVGHERSAVVAAAAIATITVNHPTAAVALLAGTPVVHLGRALYDLPGVTTRTDLGGLGAAVNTALASNRGALRRRFLTWQLRHGHVWCSPTLPNYNGMLGLVQAVERRLAAPPADQRPLPYRAGPTWPLAAR